MTRGPGWSNAAGRGYDFRMTCHRTLHAFTVIVAIGIMCAASTARAEAPWPAVLTPSHAELLPSLPTVRWRGDLRAAMDEARRENRPVFVTMRCLPCKQCSAFDKNVLEGGNELDPLLKQSSPSA